MGLRGEAQFLKSEKRSGRLAGMWLMFRCPNTGREVQSSIETTEKALCRLGTLHISVWCEHCGAPHTISAAEAWVGLVRDSADA